VTKLTPAEQNAFNAASVALLSQNPAMTPGQRLDARGENMVNFIRGQRGNEGFVAGSPTGLYRTRAHVLGDFVNSQPLYVGAPFLRYQDAGYGAFATANVNRTPMVYVGGNDGMLHAFYAGTGPGDPQGGKEAWAVIPQTVLPNLWQLADASYKTQHRYFVDGSPTVGDVFDTGSGTWRTVLVQGLNAGGKAFFALDVTTPTQPKALWEFRASAAACPVTPALAVGNAGDCNLGLSFGKPVVTKLGGTWVVMITSGYNNLNSASNGADGGGFLYILNAMTGRVIHKVATGQGDAGTPSGLAQINNFVDNTYVDNTTIRAYGGDLLGNIWRFQFPLASTPLAQLLGTAKDTSGALQPITTRPELAEVDSKPMVFVGTGRLLGSADVTDVSRQSIYGFVDPLTSVYPNLRNALRPLSMNQFGGATGDRSTKCVDVDPTKCARTAGWVLDLPENGERINVGMKLHFGALIAASNVPESASCSTGGHGWLNVLDYRTGMGVDSAQYLNSDPALGHTVSQYVPNALIAGFNIFKLPSPTGGRYSAQIHRVDGTHIDRALPPQPLGPSGRRISWREIVQ
jgi:type IV pilus assembly protein PilY1